jgi:hypothetical protein
VLRGTAGLQAARHLRCWWGTACSMTSALFISVQN